MKKNSTSAVKEDRMELDEPDAKLQKLADASLEAVKLWFPMNKVLKKLLTHRICAKLTLGLYIVKTQP